MHPTKNDLSGDVRAKIVELLNQHLANLIDLQLQSKQAHWNVKGPHFIGLHKLFDDVAGKVTEMVDSVAERITALGGTADGTAKAVFERSRLTPYSTHLIAGRDHVDALSTALATAGAAVRAEIDRATQLGDADTADLFTEISRELDQTLWFVEAHLQGER